MGQLLEAFLLGNSSILTNVCLLPLYPGLIAFLAGNATNERSQRATGSLGALVLAGVLTLMVAVGTLLFVLKSSFGSVLPWLVPLIYGVVAVLGLVMLFGFNPFNRLAGFQTPVLKNPYLTAYVYGLALGPMTLPCTGPFFLSGVLIGSNSLASFGDGLLYFLFFGLGFGWPLVLLPLLALPMQRHATGWLTKNYQLLTRASGALLLGIGVFGLWTEVLPQYL